MQLLALAATALALVGSSVAQSEASRFGIVSVSPSSVKPGQTFTVHYNSTLAQHQPVFYDTYIQGTVKASGFVQQQYLLARNTFPTDGTKIFDFTTTLPAIDPNSPTLGYDNQTSYGVRAFITFPSSNEPNVALAYGGTGTGIEIDLS